MAMTIDLNPNRRPEPAPRSYRYVVGSKVACIKFRDEPETMIAVRVVRQIHETETIRLPLWQQIAFS